MSTALKLLAGIVLASLFMGIFVGVKGKYDRSREITQFKNSAKEMASKIELLGEQEPPAQVPYEIVIPEECQIKFENENVIAVITNTPNSYPTGIKIIGENLSPGSHNLKLLRTSEGVEIS